jgi:hypothetical protein
VNFSDGILGFHKSYPLKENLVPRFRRFREQLRKIFFEFILSFPTLHKANSYPNYHYSSTHKLSTYFQESVLSFLFARMSEDGMLN